MFVLRSKLIVALLVFAVSIPIGQFDSLNDLAERISENLDAYQVTIFINRSERIISAEQNIVLKKLTCLNPSVVIDISNFNYTTVERYVQPKVIEKPTYTFLNLILINGKYNDTESEILRVRAFLDLSNHLSPSLIRPKSLIVFFHRSSISKNLFKAMLKAVWYERFLDFSIIEVNLNDNYSKNITGYLHYFNPFFNTFVKKPYPSDKIIFIDKLKNLNQYPIILLLLNHTMILKVTSDSNGKTKVAGFYHSLLLTALHKMNFKIVYYVSHIESNMNTVILKHSLNLLKKGYVNMLSVAYSYVPYDFPAIDIGYDGFESFVAIVPIIRYTNIKIPYYTLILLFFIPILITLTINMAYWLRIQKEKIDVIYVAQILYGVPVTIYPHKWTDRIIFFGIVCISIQYSMDYFSNLVDDYMIDNEMYYNNFKDIADAPFDIYINQIYINRYLSDNDKYIQKIRKKVKSLNDIYECINLFKASKSVICLTSKIYADYSTTLYYDDNEKPIMKIAKPIFAYEKLRFLCENYLPYGAKLKQFFQKLHQAGISTLLKQRYLNNNRIIPRIKTKKDSKKLLFLCCLILCVGYVISLIVFCAELTIIALKNKITVRKIAKLELNKNK